MTMKRCLLLPIFIFSLVHTSAGAQSCGNLSGDYSTGKTDFTGRTFVFSLVQSGCDSIAVGSYSLKDGVKGDLVAPAILYVSATSKNLCGSASCTIFEGIGTGITFARNGLVDVNGVTCSYDRVEWTLDNAKNLIQKYFLNDPLIP